MHPAPSLIIFTTLSGLGFGLLAFLGLGLPEATGWHAFVLYGIGYALSVAGLLASTFHLGHPERAWRALSQWRSSWLSREGVLAIVTLLVVAPDAAARVFFDSSIASLGLAGALLAAATVVSTGMIYAQIRAVPRWHHWTTPAVFLAAAAAGGALLAGQTGPAAVLLLLLALALMLHWRAGDRRFAEAGSSMESATGLGVLGRVRLLAPPHTGNNYLLREMVHVVGRRHSARLRLIGLAAGALLPALVLTWAPAGYLAVLFALALHVTGLMAARWLFYAEAEHVVGLYYGRR